MTASGRNNGRADLFRGDTVADIELRLKHQYCRLTTETAADYWLFAEFVRELGKRKRVAAKRWLDWVVEDYAFDGKSVEIAMVIRENHDDLDSLAGMTAPQALRRSRDPKVKNGGDGRARPRPSVLPPTADSIPQPATNGNDGPARNQEDIASGGKTTKVKGLRLLSEVAARPVEWLWEGRIPLGEMTICRRPPRHEQDHAPVRYCGRLTVGREMPCVQGKAGRQQSGGLFLVGEDSVAKTVRQRLLAAGADLSRVGIMDAVVIPDDIRTIRKAIKEIDAKLLVVDTLNDFLSCNVSGNQTVRLPPASDPGTGRGDERRGRAGAAPQQEQQRMFASPRRRKRGYHGNGALAAEGVPSPRRPEPAGADPRQVHPAGVRVASVRGGAGRKRAVTTCCSILSIVARGRSLRRRSNSLRVSPHSVPSFIFPRMASIRFSTSSSQQGAPSSRHLAALRRTSRYGQSRCRRTP